MYQPFETNIQTNYEYRGFVKNGVKTNKNIKICILIFTRDKRQSDARNTQTSSAARLFNLQVKQNTHDQATQESQTAKYSNRINTVCKYTCEQYSV